ncbi:hypothetical protein P4O66_006457 [Electrophorus voltai]|uniref:BAR domain-containing protein n=1 Tax=Electrophorus voltai TaxID=2609070 RepID=A0AAD9E0N8_9TELE|nr:hypothetical protein P4O66_006457 [Electrophorus voltai]
MIEAGRAYVSANKLFINGIRDLSHHCKEETITECLEKCGESLQEIVNYHMVRHGLCRQAVYHQCCDFLHSPGVTSVLPESPSAPALFSKESYVLRYTSAVNCLQWRGRIPGADRRAMRS